MAGKQPCAGSHRRLTFDLSCTDNTNYLWIQLNNSALSDFGEMEKLPGADTRIMKVPAPLLCYWIGQAESLQSARPREG